MYGYIYKRVNKLNGMIYVGMHKYDKPELDLTYRGSGCLFNRELSIFGEENFTYELVDTADSYDELNDLEKYYISFFDCKFPNGYNIHEGGCNYVYDPETSDKYTLSEYSKYLWQQPWYREKTTQSMSIGHLGKSSGMKGKKFNEEELERFRMNSTGRRWFTDGQVEVFVYSCPEGFYEGRVDKEGFKSNLGNVWITNGKTTISVRPEEVDSYIQQGFYKGRTLDYIITEETRQLMREKSGGKNNPMYGTHYVNISKDGIKKRVPPEQLQEFLDNGWVRGWKSNIK